jgi:hypothetical protein
VVARAGQPVSRALPPRQRDAGTVAAPEGAALHRVAPPVSGERSLDVDRQLLDLRCQLERL